MAMILTRSHIERVVALETREAEKWERASTEARFSERTRLVARKTAEGHRRVAARYAAKLETVRD